MSSGTDNSTDLSSSSSNSYVINERIDKEDSRRRRKAPAPVVNKSKKKQWWQRNMVRQTATFVQADVDAITNNSSFLKQNHPEETNNLMAYFNRSEIQTGCVVGQGGFSIVYEIVAFHLDPDLSRQMKPEYQAIREQYAVTALDPQTGQGRYVIKHLQEHLLHRKADYSIAASDMALEAEYLRRIDHPHIVKLRGLPVTGVKALEDGRHDGYFLILDRLEETLDQRIKSWKKMEDQEDKPTVHAAKIGYAKNLASALEYLHGNRIIYRDLKPQNVGFDVEGNIQLFDFGLCRELPDGIADMEDVYEMSGVGTRRFMAPEIILDSHYNAKADVYSWSMVVSTTYSM